jgi:NADPH:quinone reductase-like Zn-dependent oxidoreductase
MDDTMKAVAHATYGGPETIVLRDVPKPVPADDEMLVRVRAASVNRSDWEALTGTPLYARMNGLRTPRRQILGSDVAGTVEAVGTHHSDFRPGDEVLGEMESYSDGFAEYVCTRGRDWVRKPPSLTFEQAAAIPQAAVIALQATRGRVRPGDRVLINGAGGGTGSFAIQLAKSQGAEVTGVDNTGKLDFLRSLGADHALDYTHQDFTRTGAQYDLILDVVADRSAFDYARALRRGGSYYAAGGNVGTFLQILAAGPWLRAVRKKDVRVLVVRRNRADLAFVTDLCAAGKLLPVIDSCYPLTETAEALRRVGDGKVQGKVVVIVSEARKGDAFV